MILRVALILELRTFVAAHLSTRICRRDFVCALLSACNYPARLCLWTHKSVQFRHTCIHLFAIYTSPIAMITHSFQVCHQQYADDTQLFIASNPSDPSSDISNLTSCLHVLQIWFCLNGMALNPDKSDAILLGTRQHSRCYATLCSVDVAGCSVLLSDHIKVLGVTLDSHLFLDRHISSICKSAIFVRL